MFRLPGRIDVLLGVDIFVQVLLHGRRIGLPGSPVVLRQLGRVLASNTATCHPMAQVTTYLSTMLQYFQATILNLRRFWETEESPTGRSFMSPEELSVVHHFKANHYLIKDARFVVPLPPKPGAKALWVNPTLKRYIGFSPLNTHSATKVSLRKWIQSSKNTSNKDMPKSYLMLIKRNPLEIFYLPVHAVHKESSTTIKVCTVLDASAKSSTGVSSNDLLLVGPTVHPPLVLLRFR